MREAVVNQIPNIPAAASATAEKRGEEEGAGRRAKGMRKEMMMGMICSGTCERGENWLPADFCSQAVTVHFSLSLPPPGSVMLDYIPN